MIRLPYHPPTHSRLPFARQMSGRAKGSHPRLGACQSEKQELGLARSLCDSGSITNIIVRPLFKRVEKKKKQVTALVVTATPPALLRVVLEHLHALRRTRAA